MIYHSGIRLRLLLFMRLLLAILAAACTASAFAEKINLNLADAETLESISGIGPVKAREIVRYRRANGPFLNLDDLLEVPGIGEKTLAKLRAQGSLSGGTSRVDTDSQSSRSMKRQNKKQPEKSAAKSRSTAKRKEAETIPGYSYEELFSRSRM